MLIPGSAHNPQHYKSTNVIALMNRALIQRNLHTTT
jgi:hypothetical protein